MRASPYDSSATRMLLSRISHPEITEELHLLSYKVLLEVVYIRLTTRTAGVYTLDIRMMSISIAIGMLLALWSMFLLGRVMAGQTAPNQALFFNVCFPDTHFHYSTSPM